VGIKNVPPERYQQVAELEAVSAKHNAYLEATDWKISGAKTWRDIGMIDTLRSRY